MKANKSRHLNKSVGMRKIAKINKRRAYAYSEDKSTSSESRLFADDFIISVSFLRLRYRESPNSADFGANRNRTIRKSALKGDLYVLTKSAPFWYKNWHFFWKKPHYIKEFGQFSSVLKPH